jgi:ferredoxin
LCSNTNCSSGAESRCIAHGFLAVLVWSSPNCRCRVPSEQVISGRGGPVSDELEVRVDQDLCTGDGLCVQYAPEVFEFDVDGLAYVKGGDGELRLNPGSRVGVPAGLRLHVIDAAKECPGECIHVTRLSDGAAVAGPEAA